MSYKKLSPTELVSLGFSRTSERYRDNETGTIISKRQYQKIQRGGATYTTFRRDVIVGKRQHAPNTPRAAVEEKKRKSRVRREKASKEKADILGGPERSTLKDAVRKAHRYKRPVMIAARLEVGQGRYANKRYASLIGWTIGRHVELEDVEKSLD